MGRCLRGEGYDLQVNSRVVLICEVQGVDCGVRGVVCGVRGVVCGVRDDLQDAGVNFRVRNRLRIKKTIPYNTIFTTILRRHFHTMLYLRPYSMVYPLSN